MSKKSKKAKVTKPMDPAEVARLAYENRQRQRNPENWGPNMMAMTLDQNQDVGMTAATREKVARLKRYDCFVTLGLTVDQYQAVRRYEDLIAIRYAVTGAASVGEKVDGAASGRALSESRVKAIDTMNELDKLADRKWSLLLIEHLVSPAVLEGRRANWKDIVRKDLGLIDRDAQARAVKLAAQDLVGAWTVYDNSPQKKVAA